MEEIKIITDGEIENLCKVIRRPGGINHITNIAKLGLQVSLRAENNLKLASFSFKHKIRIRRVAVETNIKLDNVRLLRDLNDIKMENTDPLVSTVIDANS